MINGVQVSVPDVTGMSVSAATKALQAKGFHVKTDTTKVYSDVAPSGSVGATSPGAGSRVTRGTLVMLQLSQGPQPAPPPPPPTLPPTPGGGHTPPGHTLPPGFPTP
jgi:beta-lactam-binding protein with PASTA domain